MPSSYGDSVERNTKQLVGVLRAAHRYQFHRVCALTIELVRTELDPLPALQLALLCGAAGWAMEQFTAVVLGFDDIPLPATLDAHTAAKIWKARSRVIALRTRHLNGVALQLHHQSARGKPQYTEYKLCSMHLMQLLNCLPAARRERFLEVQRREALPRLETLPGAVPAVDPADASYLHLCNSLVQWQLEEYVGPREAERLVVQTIWEE